MSNKIFITGSYTIDKMIQAKNLLEKNDDLSIGERFTTNLEYKDSKNDEYLYYMDSTEIDLAYKNNALLFVETSNYVSTGITMDSYYNDDIFVMSIEEFNNISNVIFNSKNNDILVIWLDGNVTNTEESRKDINESKYLEERLLTNNINYMYFFNEDIDAISNIIDEYLLGDETTKARLLEENC